MPGLDGPYAAWLETGRALLRQWRLDEAERAFAAAVRLRPDDPAGHYLLGEALFLQRRLGDALACHDAAVRCAQARGVGRGDAMSGMVPGDFGWMSHMLRGDFPRAWTLADHDREQRRLAGIRTDGWPRHLRPVWDGGSLAGSRVLVRCYHGLGDTIQFIRYAPLLAGRAAAVTVEAQPELIRLLRRVPGIAALHALPAAEDRSCAAYGCDAEIDVTELPHAFRTRLATIPAAVPYLHVEPARAGEAARRLGALRPRLAVGVAWAAGEWKPERSLPFASLAPLMAVPGVALVNLQRGPEYRRWRAEPRRLPLTEIYDTDAIDDAAATIAGLDLVVTVDTMVAHLAGALGVPVWLMLHFAADWRWLLGRDDSPWYPTVRLFRQNRPGDWAPVIAEIASALQQRAAGNGGSAG